MKCWLDEKLDVLDMNSHDIKLIYITDIMNGGVEGQLCKRASQFLGQDVINTRFDDMSFDNMSHGKYMVIINKGNTKMEGKADLVFNDSIGKVMNSLDW